MMKRKIGAGVLLVAALAALTAGNGTSKGWALVTSTGAILGRNSPQTLLPKGKSQLSIAEIVAGTTPSIFYITSRDIGTSGNSTADTIYVGNGIAYNDYYPDGVDSLACIQVGAGAQLTVAVDNKP